MKKDVMIQSGYFYLLLRVLRVRAYTRTSRARRESRSSFKYSSEKRELREEIKLDIKKNGYGLTETL